ncbi:MAG: hypothetical protein ACI8RZ_002048 [Myxococcota bacterium]|jgi:hypothetical protein
MKLLWPRTEPWEGLRDAIAPVLVPVLHASPTVPIALVEGSADGPDRVLSADGLILSPDLIGPQRHARRDRRWLTETPPALASLALSRQHRGAGLIAEGILLHRMAAQVGCSPADLPVSWWTLGVAADALDRQLPELGWLWQSAAGLMMEPWYSMDDQPRRGAWFLRWRRQQGRPLIFDSLHAPAITAEEWAAFGQWCRDPLRGPGASAPLTLPPAPPRPIPTIPVPPLSHHPIRWSAGPAGLRVDGGVLVPPVRLAGGEDVIAVLGSVDGGVSPLSVRPARLVGRWLMRSGLAGERLGVAEGIALHFHPAGRLDITLASAWMGPADLESRTLVRQIGASGSGSGRWQVRALDPIDGFGVVTLSDLNIDQISVHPRRPRMRRFALPAADNHLTRVRRLLGQLSGRPVTFALAHGELRLDGELKNFNFQIRLTPA